MKSKFPQPVWAADDGGGASVPPAPPSPAPVQAPPAGPPAGGQAPAAVAPVPPPAAPPPAYWPDGLDQSYRGADDKTTLDNLAKALKGYRDRDAARDLPQKLEDYWNFDNLQGSFKIEQEFQPYFDLLPADPVFKGMAQALQQHGVGRTAALAIYQSGLAAMKQSGLLEPLVDYAAEKKALVPETARTLPEPEQLKAAEKRIGDNFAFVDLMVANRGLDKEAGEYAKMMLGDMAKGHKLFEWMKTQVQGAKAGPVDPGGGGGGDSKEALRAEMAALKQGDPDYRNKHDALMERYKQVHGA